MIAAEASIFLIESKIWECTIEVAIVESFFGKTKFKSTYCGESVICNYCSGRMHNSVLEKLTPGEVVIDAISFIRRLRRARCTFVDHSTRFYLHDIVFYLFFNLT